VVGQDVLHLILDGCILGSSFCRQSVQRGGVCNFIKKDKRFNKIGTLRHCKEQDLEICAFQLRTETCNLIMLSLYRYFCLPAKQKISLNFISLTHIVKVVPLYAVLVLIGG
jgi:hypothetical protein